MQYTYRVYIIDLKKSVLDCPKFKARNPNYREGKPCVYVGSAGIDVEKRFEQHKAGYKSNRYANKYGRRLRYRDMGGIRPRKTRASIEQKEAEVAEQLQQKGWAVWWG
ncbi:GIY-YIG nuclease family protein [Pseudomonadota bacterium]